MRKILILFFMIVGYTLSAQVGISTTTPSAATELEVYSPGNNGGILIPRMTEAQMKAIVNPSNGLFVYNTDKQKFMYNIGTAGSPNWTILGEIARMTGAQISAIATPIQGDIRYDTTTNSIWYYDGTHWQELSNAAAP